MNNTSVVNCKVKYIRPKYKNLKEWMSDENNVYIARRGIVFINGQRFPPYSSVFCNPFKIGKDGNREKVIQLYKEYINRKITNDPSLKLELIKLKGKNLGCWCAPEKCHGNVLLELINEN